MRSRRKSIMLNDCGANWAKGRGGPLIFRVRSPSKLEAVRARRVLNTVLIPTPILAASLTARDC